MQRIIFLTLIGLWLFPVLSAETSWFAGTARIKITPEAPLVMSGYANRTDPFTSVRQDIWAKALVLQDETGHQAVIITTDLVGIASDISPAIYSGITDKTGIERKDILLTWSHTHSAPRLTLEADTQDELRQDAVAYSKELQNQLIHLVEVASRSLQPVELNWGAGFVPFVMNRRQRTPTGIRLDPNPSGHVDRSMPCMKITTTSGDLMAVLFQVACHNTTLGSKNLALCGDYSGFAQSGIEEFYPGANAMFMTGCAGNANPYPRGTMEIAEQHGRTVAREVCRMLEEAELSKVEGPLTTVLDRARLPLQAAKPMKELKELAAQGPNYMKGNANRMIEILEGGGSLPTHYDAPVSVWQFGKDLTLVALSGEVVSGYVLETQKAIGHRKLWIAAYVHDYFGYLPTARIIRDGGYEARGLFNGTGWFDEKAEETMIHTITKLALQAGRTFE